MCFTLVSVYVHTVDLVTLANILNSHWESVSNRLTKNMCASQTMPTVRIGMQRGACTVVLPLVVLAEGVVPRARAQRSTSQLAICLVSSQRYRDLYVHQICTSAPLSLTFLLRLLPGDQRSKSRPARVD
jgi:hypothetical protein